MKGATHVLTRILLTRLVPIWAVSLVLLSAPGAWAQTPVLDLDFQGDPADTGWGNDPINTQAGFTAFNLRRLDGVPSSVISTNPSVTVGPVTFAITGEVGGFGTAASGNDDLDHDFMFLGAPLGFDESVTWTLSGLAANTTHRLTWYAGLEGGTDRSALIQSGATAASLISDCPDLVLYLSSDASGTITGTVTRTGSNTTECNLCGLSLEEAAAPQALAAGDVIAVDVSTHGGSAANFNVMNVSAAGLGAGSVIDYNDGIVRSGVSVALTTVNGFNDDANANNWGGTAGDGYYVTAADDIAHYGSPISLTFSGLNDALLYHARVYVLIGDNPTVTDTITVTDGAGTRTDVKTRGTRWAAATLDAAGGVFNGLQTDGSGNIVVTSAATGADILNAVVLEAVAAGSPILSGPTVTNITMTTARGGVTLAGTNAYVTLFWGESNEGEAFTWDETNSLPAEQSIGGINNVLIDSLAGDTTYYYIFYASNSVGGATDWSDLSTSFATPMTGKAISDLSANAVSALEIDLSWTDGFNTETGFVVQRSPDGNPPWTTLATTAAGATSYPDLSVDPSSTYHYRVAATNGASLSDWSNVAQATTPAGTSDPNAPQHWWKIDEASGTLVRDWGLTGGMDGTLVQDGSGVGTLTRVTPSASRAGNALDYTWVSGVSGGYVNAGNLSMNGTFTVNVWVDPNNVNDDWRFFAAKFPVGGNRRFWVGQHGDNGRIRYSISSTGSDEIALDSAGIAIGNNCWQMATVTWNETTKSQKLYVNGVLNNETNRVGVSLLTPRSGDFCIMNGYNTAGTLQFYGTADDCRVYNRELDADEIRALYANPGAEAPSITIVGEDIFSGPALETGWTVDDRDAADPLNLSARAGWLRTEMNAQQDVWVNNRGGGLMLHTDAPSGSFTAETRVDTATGNGGSSVVNSGGGLVIVDPSYVIAQYPFAIHYYLSNHGGTDQLALQKPGGDLAGKLTVASTSMYLKLYRDADAGTWEASYKANAGDAWTVWHTFTDGDLPNAYVSDTDIYVGLMSKVWGTSPTNIDYDHFEIPEVNAPTGTLLLIQ